MPDIERSRTVNVRLLIPVILVAFTLACGGSSPEPTPTPQGLGPAKTRLASTAVAAPKVANGTFVLSLESKNAPTKEKYAVGQPCEGFGGYSDVKAGMEVTLLADGKVVELARFSAGKVTKSAHYGTTADFDCTFTFSLPVPDEGEFFQVKVGRRGEQTYRREELLIPGALAFTLGD